MIQAIRFKGIIKNEYDGFDNSGFILNIEQINTFVGANNSGKSRLLRELFSNGEIDYYQQISQEQVEEIKKIYTPIVASIKALVRYGKTYKYQNSLDRFITDFEKADQNIISNLSDINFYLNTIELKEFEQTNQSNIAHLNSQIASILIRSKKITETITRIGKSLADINKIYIPILRGLRPIGIEDSEAEKIKFVSTNLYLKRTKYDYFENEIKNGKLFTGLSIYEEIKKLLLGDELERNEIKEFEKFLGENIFKDKITLIPKYGDDVLHIKIGDNKQFPIYQLGDGIQSLVIILFPVFANRSKESIIFIEEPETHLHPKWQRLLSRALKEFNNHTYFLSTHSSAIINSPSNSIFIISQQDSKTNIHFSDIKIDKVEILKELGYKPNDLYQTNYILWVEGQSDKIYVNYLIKKYAPELKEDEDYSIMFYGGSSYKHFLINKGTLNLDFIQSLNQNYGIILDSDRTKPREKYNKQKKEIEKLFNKSKAFCWLTKFREIENYIPINIFEKAVKKVHKLTGIRIDTSNFGDRNTIEDLKAKPSYKSKIKLSETIFQQIQKNKDGTTKNIDAKLLRKEIEASIQQTRKVTQEVNKVRVAQEVVDLGFDPSSDEMEKKIKTLINEIKKANE